MQLESRIQMSESEAISKKRLLVIVLSKLNSG